MVKYFFLFAFSIGFSVGAYECPPEFKDRSKLPLCGKTSQPQILSDNYPVGAIVVSSPDSASKALDPMQTTYDFIYKMANFNDPLPLIVVPLTKNQYESLKAKLLGSDLDPQKKVMLLKRLAHAETPGGSYTWQQDYFQSTVGSNGQVQLRPNQLYVDGRQTGEHFNGISKILASCGVAVGAPLDPKNFLQPGEKLPGGTSGGNIEALPDGSCLIGDDAFPSRDSYDKFVKNICDPKDNIRVPTHWLDVGHTDEIMKVLPNPKGKAPCNFSVAIASPDLAIELMEKNPEDMFISPENTPSEYKNTEEMIAVRRGVNDSLRNVCGKLDIKKYPVDAGDSAPDEGGGVKSQSYFKSFEQLLRVMVPQAMAELMVESLEGILDDQPDFFFANKSVADAEKAAEDINASESGSVAESEEAAKKGATAIVTCSTAKNKHLAKLYRDDSELSKTNKYVQQNMDLLEGEVTNKLRAKFPGCKIDIVKFPQLFESKFDAEGRPTGANSINANPTNSVVIGKHIYIPDQGNSAFQKDIREKMKKMGLTPHFVNTFEFAHSYGGNLHCSSQTIPLCR